MARLDRRGLDFGYTNDPSALIDIYRYNGGFIFDEVFYQKGLSNKQIADIINNTVNPKIPVYADSAEPKSIDEIRLHGIPIVPAVKGRGSVNQGIQFIQDQKIMVTKRSTNIIKEYRRYLWEVDRNGESSNVPIDLYNHAMDAIRYGLTGYRERTKEKSYTPNFKSYKRV